MSRFKYQIAIALPDKHVEATAENIFIDLDYAEKLVKVMREAADEAERLHRQRYGSEST